MTREGIVRQGYFLNHPSGVFRFDPGTTMLCSSGPGERAKYGRGNILIKLRVFRLAVACASIAALVESLAAVQKWG